MGSFKLWRSTLKLYRKDGDSLPRKKASESKVADTVTKAPMMSADAEEKYVISLAVELAKKQLIEGTASSQVITHYLKLGSSQQRLEMEKLQNENELLQAKVRALESAKKAEELYSEALNAIRRYNGYTDDDSDLL